MSTTNFINGNKFVLGTNLAWLDDKYDNDFGKNQILNINTPAYADPTHKANLSSYLQDMQKMGIQVVRLWVFEKFEGLLFDDTGSVTGIDQSLVDNLADACSIASKSNLMFYLCLMDTWTIWQDAEPARTTYVNTMNGLITTPAKTNSFLSKAVIPLLTDKRIKNSIFAVDVLNEPEGLDTANTNQEGTYQIDTKISWGQLIEFIITCADSIKKGTNLKVSCGFQHLSGMQKNQNELVDHLDFFDFHMYSDTVVLPDCSSLNLKKPCIIGECGQQTVEWNDDLQLNVTNSFLNTALNKGYAGCFPWYYNYKGFTDLTKNYLSLINNDGSWRPVCNMINKFSQKINSSVQN